MSIDYKLLLNPGNSSQVDSISPGLLDFIKQSEGFSDSAFFDNKQFSIGYGTRANSANESIDEEEATKRLQERLSADRTKIIKFANDNGYNWGPDQINALQSFTYNLGIGALNQLTDNGTRSDSEIAEAMVKYVNAGGEPQPGLVARRQRERLAFINPANQNETDPSAFRSDGSRKSQRGFLGPKENVNTGETMTEFSIGVKIDGEETEIPSMIPGLTDEEIQAITRGEVPDSVPPKAKEFALKRRAEGKPYFYQDGEELEEVAVNQRRYEPSPSDVGAAIEYLRTSGVHRSRFDINDPFHMMLVNNAREHARGRISRGENPFYEGGTKGDPETRLKHLFNVLTPDVVDNRVPDLFSKGYKPGDAFKQYKDQMGARRDAKFVGVLRSIAGGLTFELADELEALIRSELGGSVTKEGDYKSELALIRKQQKDFEYFNPIASTAPNLLMTLPVGGALWKTAKMLAPKASNAAIAASEGALYGAGQGDTFKQRVDYAGMGALFGLAMGKVIDLATTPSSAGGLRTELDELADSKLGSEEAVIEQLEKAAFEETLEEVSNPLYNVKPLRDAQTIGEFYDSLLQNGRKFFGDKLRGVSDSLAAEVSERFGFLYQRADTAALREINKGLAKLGPRLIPVIKVINESERAKGALLDYAGGKMLTKQELGDFYFDSAQRDARGRFKKRLSPEQRAAKAKELRELAVSRLENELKGYLDTEQLNALKSYLTYSFQKNKLLNKKVFGAEFGDEITYLHTRNRKWRDEIMEAESLDAKGFELKYGDTAYEGRTRGSYLDPDDMTGPVVSEYDNPIVSDMQRIFKMEKFGQLQSKFGIDISPVLAGKLAARSAAMEAGEQVPTTTALTPTEFMDAFYHTLVRKGLTNEGAQYGVNKIQDHILGTAKSPNPLIQALNSAAYALTLAGPLSAVLNLADIPLLGAKYGGKAVGSGLKGVLPNRLKQIPDVDVEAMGLNNQTFGEFVSLINDNLNYPQGWMTRTAELMRQGADYAMKGSGFASLDIVGKRGVIRGVLRSAADDANAGNLADNWGFYFNKKELELISEQLTKHGTDWRKYEGAGKDLVEELMFAGLGQQQLISAAGRPAAWARHPNLRPLWALRGFVIKQQALALRETLGNLRKGRPDLAVKFLGRYAAYGAGGYAVINEGRHAIFGDGNVSAGGLVRGYGDAWASLLTANTLGLNDYQYGKIKEEGILMTFAKGMMPIALTRPYDIGAKTVGVIDGKRPPQALLTEVPIVRDALRVGENIADEDSFIGTVTQGELADQSRNEMFRELLRQRNTADD